MERRKRHPFFRKRVNSSGSILILSLIALALFIIGEFREIVLLQGFAGVLGGAVLTLFVTNITSGEAVAQQNAKEANLARKNVYYIPLFNELKQLFDLLEEARLRRLPYPQLIDGVEEVRQPSFIWKKYPIPSFTNWQTFQEEPDRSNFTEKACKLFEAVQKSSEVYNRAVRETKDSVITILTPKIDEAFRSWANRDDFKQWKEETQGGTIWSAAQFQEWHRYIKSYLERPPGQPDNEAQMLVWAHNIIGWILVDNLDEASIYMQRLYQYDFHTNVTPDAAWFRSILESVWSELQVLGCVKEVRAAAGELLARTVQAKDYMQDRLDYIRDMYEGGEPPL